MLKAEMCGIGGSILCSLHADKTEVFLSPTLLGVRCVSHRPIVGLLRDNEVILENKGSFFWKDFMMTHMM